MLSQSRQARQGIRDKCFIYLIMHTVFFEPLRPGEIRFWFNP